MRIVTETPDCEDRIRLDSERFRCRSKRVFSRNDLVDVVLCGRCEYKQARESAEAARTFRSASSTQLRLFAVPAESLARDPSGGHKSAYIRLLAQAFAAELLLLEQEEQLVSEVERRKPELVITMNLPWYNRFSDRPIAQLPRQLPVVTVHDDCRRQMHPRLEAVLDRSVAVISPARSPVLHPCQFPQFTGKLFWLPYFVPDGIPAYPVNLDPLRKCLLSGAVNQRYPLRLKALQTISRTHLDVLAHPGYWRTDYSTALLGLNYYEYVHQYLAAITCGSVFRCVVAKYLEIPFSGCLLIAENLPDLPAMGFVPGTHFVAISHTTDLAAAVAEVLDNPAACFNIRCQGQYLVQSRHTERARWGEACEMARGVLALAGLRDVSPERFPLRGSSVSNES